MSATLRTDECGRTEQAAAPDVADRDLTAVAGVHVHAEKPANDHPETFRLRLGIHRDACEDLDQPANRRERRHRPAGQ
jgi:hypothetical protein